MKKRKVLGLIIAVCMVLTFAVGCSSGGGNAGGSPTAPGGSPTAPGGGTDTSGAPTVIKIGIPNPTTGALASFGIGSPWAENLIVDYVNKTEGGIMINDYIGADGQSHQLGKKLPIECVFADTQSDSNKAGEVAQQMITNDKVNVLIARHTPGTALPVSQTAEANKVPCVSLECPVESWAQGGPYTWVYHSFWKVEDACNLYMAMWQQLGFGKGTVVGFLFPNDPDGLAWQPIFTQMLTDAGYVISDPGQYPIGNTDWTAVINKFKQDKVDVLTGCDVAPDFTSFLAQAKQQSLSYKFISMGRAILFPADANASPPDLIDGATCEVWWSPWHPFTSSLTGSTCAQLATAYEKQTGVGWSAPMGYKYAGMEIVVDALTRAASLDPVKIRDAIAATDLDTIVGHIKYDQTTHVAPTPIVGGQWKLDSTGKAVELRIVYNQNHPNIPTNATLTLPSQGDGTLPAAPF